MYDPNDTDDILLIKAAEERDQIPTTGPQAIQYALQNLDIDKLEADAIAELKSGKKTKRPKAVAMLNIVKGMRRNETTPADFMISAIPVIPPKYRPFSAMNGQLIAGDANILYKDALDILGAYKEEQEMFGDENTGEARLQVYNAVKSVYGYGDAVKPKTKAKDVQGFLQKIVGSTSKYSFPQRKLFSKTQDNVGRSTVIVDPELNIDEVGLPEDLAFVMYAPFLQRRLKLTGLSDVDALRHVRDRTDTARNALIKEMEVRPIIHSRAPVWHGLGIVGARPKLIKGDAIAVNAFTTSGQNMDFDGDDQIGSIFGSFNINELREIDEDFATDLENIYLLNYRPSVKSVSQQNQHMFTNIDILTKEGMGLIALDLADFPRTTLAGVNKKNGYDIEFYNVPESAKVPAYDETTNQIVMASVASWSIHKGREVEIVKLSNGLEIYTDDDPRAVYGIAKNAETLVPSRFTPTEALANAVLVPYGRTPDLATTSNAFFNFRNGKLSKEKEDDVLCVPVDYDLGQFLGCLAGDGWVDVVSALKISDLEYFNADFVENYIRTHFDKNVEVKHYESYPDDPGSYGRSTTHRFNFDTRKLVAERISKLIGGRGDDFTTGSANKHLPKWFRYAPKEFQLGLLNGLIATDGSISVSNGKSKPQLMIGFSSTSIRLCRELIQIVNTLECRASLTYSKETTAGNDHWQVTIGATYAKNAHLFDNCCHERKATIFKDTPVSQDPTHLTGDIIPFPTCISEHVIKWIKSPKISATYKTKFTGTEAEWEKRVAQATFASSVYISARNGYLTRELARRLFVSLEEYEKEGIESLTLVAKILDAYKALYANKTIEAIPGSCTELAKAVDFILPVASGVDDEKKKLINDTKRIISTVNRLGKITKTQITTLCDVFTKYNKVDMTVYNELFASWKSLYESDINWLKIKNVEKTGKAETGYDLTVPGFETFMNTDGVILSNTVNVHVPASDAAVKEVYEKMMPSLTPFSNREEDRIVPLPKQENISGIYSATKTNTGNTHEYDTEEDALEDIRKMKISLSDDIVIKYPNHTKSAMALEKGPARNPKDGRFINTINNNVGNPTPVVKKEETTDK